MTKKCRPDLVFIILSIRADKSIAHKVWQTEMGTAYSLLSSMNIIIKGIIFFNIYITFSVCSTTSSTSGSATAVLLKENSRGIFEEDRSFISGRHAELHPRKKWKSLKGTFQNCGNESPGISALLARQCWPSKRGLGLFILLLTPGIFHLSLHSHQASVGGTRNRRWGFEPKRPGESNPWVHAVTPCVLMCKSGESFLPPDKFLKRITTEFSEVWKCMGCVCGTSPFRAAVPLRACLWISQRRLNVSHT